MEVEELGTTEQYVKEVTFLSDYDPGSARYRKSTMLDDDDLSLSLGNDGKQSRLEKTMYNDGSDSHVWGSGVCGVDALKKMEQIYAKLALERIGGGVEEATKDAILGSGMTEQDGIRGYFGSSSDEFMTLPMQMVGWLELGVPRFLTTTFHLVDNPETDRFICWSETQDSFIVPDHIEFSSIILPRYFRHKNFSSFIRQLNTDSKRLVTTDGSLHMFISERAGKICSKHQTQGTIYGRRIERSALEIELHLLSKQKKMLEMEVKELRQQQEASRNLIADVQNKFQLAESKYESLTIHSPCQSNSKSELHPAINPIEEDENSRGWS